MVCPAWVDTQQSAEPYSIMAATKLASYMGVNGLAIVADNTAAIAGARKGKGGIFFKARQRIFRQLHHTLRWSQQRFALYWVRSEFNPADAPSRPLKWGSQEAIALEAAATYLYMRGTPMARPTSMGMMGYRA